MRLSLSSLIDFLICNEIQIVDNVVRSGLVADPEYTVEKVEGVRRSLKAMESDEEVVASSTIATVVRLGRDIIFSLILSRNMINLYHDVHNPLYFLRSLLILI